MATLVAVCRSDDYPFDRRQLPLVVDDTLTMVVQFDDACVGCDQVAVKPKEMERFVQKFNALTKDEIAVALMVTKKEVFHSLSQLVPCVGCRRSVERLYSELVSSAHPALEPLILTKNSVLSIDRNYLFDPKAIYALFYVHRSKMSLMMDAIPKSKKNKRCTLHSLETHKSKSLSSWIDVWDVLSPECREEVVLIDCDKLLVTLENYLRKHRFCSECKSKVQRAYNILVGDIDKALEKGYCASLYEGLRCCTAERHLHVKCETDFIGHLIGRAEPELMGSRRERHAKTLDIAQEEVLTCLGIHLYDRLHRIWQKLRAEEQTWQLLFYLSVDSLKKSFEVAMEKKQGVSNLELMCEEILEEERAKEQKREQKRQKRKKKKSKANNKENVLTVDSCKVCADNTNVISDNCASCVDSSINTEYVALETCPCTGERSSPLKQSRCSDSRGVIRDDYGYSSGIDLCDSCSVPSSNDGSDVACSEGICNHDGDAGLCSSSELLDSCREGDRSSQSPFSTSQSRKCDAAHNSSPVCHSHGSRSHGNPGYSWSNCRGMTLSLLDMLEASCSSEEEDGISEEDIRQFKDNQQHLASKRQALRETLRKRFDSMQQRHACPHKCMESVTSHIGNMSVNNNY